MIFMPNALTLREIQLERIFRLMRAVLLIKLIPMLLLIPTTILLLLGMTIGMVTGTSTLNVLILLEIP